MKEFYCKCSIIVLIITCILLAVFLSKSLLNSKRYADAAFEKQQLLEKNEKEYQENLKTLTQTMDEMNARFRIVDEFDLMDTENTFMQISGRREDLNQIRKHSKSSDESIEAVWKAFSEYASAEEAGLTVNPELNYVVDRKAAVLEGIARNAGLKAETTILWDMKKSLRWARTTLTDSSGMSQTVPIGRVGTPGDSVSQNLPESIVFPIRFDLMNPNEYKVYPDMELPLGGLYIHFFKVYTSASWILEYTFPDGKDPEEYNLRYLSLKPGTKVVSAILSGNVQRFHISTPDLGTELLIVADRPFIPVKITGRLAK